MFDRSVRHRAFARLLLQATGLSSLAVAAACGGNVVVDTPIEGEGGTGGTSTSTLTTGTTGTTTTTWTTGTTGTTATTGTITKPDVCSEPPLSVTCLPPQPGACPDPSSPEIAALIAKKKGVCNAIGDYIGCCQQPSIYGVICSQPSSLPSVSECCYSYTTTMWLNCGE